MFYKFIIEYPFTIFFTVLSGGLAFHDWTLHYTYLSWKDTFDNFFASSIMALLYIVIMIGVIKFASKVDKFGGKIYHIDFQITKFSLVAHESVWKKKDFWMIFIPIQLLNFFFAVNYRENYEIWLLALPVILLFIYLTTFMQSDTYLITIILGSLLISIALFILFNYQFLGITFFYNFQNYLPLINLGYYEYDSPIYGLYEIDNLVDWKGFGFPTPSNTPELYFGVHGFGDKIFFYLYPILVFIPLYISLNFFVSIIIRNIIDSEKKIFLEEES